MNRREFVKRFLVSSFLVMTSVSAMYEMAVRLETGSPPAQTVVSQQASQTSTSSSGTTNQAQTPAGYVFVTALGGLTGKTSAYFQHPSYGVSILVASSGQWKAFSATCTHQPCTVQY